MTNLLNPIFDQDLCNLNSNAYNLLLDIGFDCFEASSIIKHLTNSYEDNLVQELFDDCLTFCDYDNQTPHDYSESHPHLYQFMVNCGMKSPDSLIEAMI